MTSFINLNFGRTGSLTKLLSPTQEFLIQFVIRKFKNKETRKGLSPIK